MNPFFLLGFMIPGVIMLLLGRYIGMTGYVEVLKQYDDKKEYNRDGLKNYVKKLMMGTGVITIVFSIIACVIGVIFEDVSTFFLIAYVLITIQYIIRLRFCCKKYEIKE